jgi:hypothetical protein
MPQDLRSCKCQKHIVLARFLTSGAAVGLSGRGTTRSQLREDVYREDPASRRKAAAPARAPSYPAVERRGTTMARKQLAATAVAVIGIGAVLLAAAVVWLSLREPMLVADAVASRDPGTVIRIVVREIAHVWWAIVRYAV